MKDMCAFVTIEVTLMTFGSPSLSLSWMCQLLLRQLCLQMGFSTLLLGFERQMQRVIQKGNRVSFTKSRCSSSFLRVSHYPVLPLDLIKHGVSSVFLVYLRNICLR
jgi:hypothetical protein